MIVIAIDGNPGSGKTTVAEELLKDKNVKVVHLDLILESIKKVVLPSKVIQNFKRTTGEEITGINQQSGLYKIIHSRGINAIYKYLKERYTSRILSKICLDTLMSGVRYLIIDGVESIKYDEICMFNYKILVKSPLETRINRLRDRATDFDEANMADVTKDITALDEKYDFIIENDASLEELLEKVQRVSIAISLEPSVIRTREKQKNENNY